VYGHPPPRSRLERVSSGSSSQSELVSTPDSTLGIELRAKTLQISQHFKRLVTVADKQIDTIMEANLEATSQEDRLDGLKLEIDRSVSRISSTIETTRRDLNEKNSELEIAQKRERQLESEKATVNRRLEGNREDRKILKVVSRVWVPF
jgi:chromosome segregation ATPase